MGRELSRRAWTVAIGMVAVPLTTACSGTDQAASATTGAPATVEVETRHDLEEFGDPANAPGYLVPIDPGSAYVRALCTIDFLAMMEADDQLSMITEAMTALPAEGEVQQAERQRLVDMVDSIGDVDGLGDPAALAVVAEIGDVLRTRCS